MVDVQELPLASLVIDTDIQQRAKIDEETVGEYADAVEHLPPIEVFSDSTTYYVTKGFHRYYAHRKAGKDAIKCIVHFGTKRDAVLAAVGDNADHGLRRTKEDKRKAVETLLNDPEWSQRSMNWVAETARVSFHFVKGIVNERGESHRERVGRNGQRVRNSQQRDTTPAPPVDHGEELTGNESADWEVEDDNPTSDSGATADAGVRPSNSSDGHGSAIDSGEWKAVSPTAPPVKSGSEVGIGPIDRAIDKSLGDLIRAIDARKELRAREANWRERYMEAKRAVDSVARSIEQWRQHKT